MTETIEHALISQDAVSRDEVLQQPGIAGAARRRGRLRQAGAASAMPASRAARRRSGLQQDLTGMGHLGCRMGGLQRCG